MFPPSVCPRPTSFPFHHSLLSMLYLVCPGPFSHLFFPHAHSSCIWGRYFHSLLQHTLPLKTNTSIDDLAEIAGAACLRLPGRPASLCGVGLLASPRCCVQAVTQGKHPPGPRSEHLSKQGSVSGSRRLHMVGETLLRHFFKRRV